MNRKKKKKGIWQKVDMSIVAPTLTLVIHVQSVHIAWWSVVDRLWFSILASGHFRSLFLDEQQYNASCCWAAPFTVDKFLLHVSVIHTSPFIRYNGDPGKTIEYSLWSPILVTYLFSSTPSHYIRYHHLQSIEHCSKSLISTHIALR